MKCIIEVAPCYCLGSFIYKKSAQTSGLFIAEVSYKPDSVPPVGGDDHLSRLVVANKLLLPTLSCDSPVQVRSSWDCIERGLPAYAVAYISRGLLLHDFTLTCKQAVCFCCTLRRRYLLKKYTRVRSYFSVVQIFFGPVLVYTRRQALAATHFLVKIQGMSGLSS